MIEFSHRISSGLILLLVIGLLFWARRTYPKGHPSRVGAAFSVAFTCVSALIGAVLVKLGWVADNASIGRAVVLSAHLVNTLLLIASLTLTAWWAVSGQRLRLSGQGSVGWAVGLGMLFTLILAVSGAVAALGDTLFPVDSLVEGFQQDLSVTAHFLIRLRVLHPLIAMSVALYLILIAGLLTHLRPSSDVRQFARWTVALFLIQLGAGCLNLVLLAPIWMQTVHLLLGNLVWMCLVLLGASALAQGVPQVEMAEVGGLTGSLLNSPVVAVRESGAVRAGWKDYVALTKPRVISLLLFTTLTAMIIAGGGWPGIGLFLATAVGFYMAAGGANAINMVLERDLDIRMARTASRPTVTEKVPPRDALTFAFGLAAGSFALLWWAANMLSALLALAGLVFYVIIYTMLLKRRTWSNIVIGGAAGAFPPLVGWAAVTNDLAPLAWCLFGIIFLWTPVHFWALALLIKDDYAKAGVPMLPVVLGERNTVVQITIYTALTVAISFLPAVWGAVGWLYVGAAVLLNAVLLLRSLQLCHRPDRPKASTLFHYSMLYLALLFLAMAVDRAHWM
jgi:protoheme IX farnesyltransferase